MYTPFCLAAIKLYDRINNRHILARLEDLNRIQWLSRGELLDLQCAKLLRLLEYAYEYVPYYRRTFDDVGLQPDDVRRDLSNLNKIPILTKDIIRKNFEELLTIEPRRRKQLNKLSTSGSTGQPLVFMQDSDFRDAVTADIQRHLGWAGLRMGDLHALIWGGNIKPTLGKRIRTKLIDLVWSRFQIDALAMTDGSMADFANRILSKKPKILFGYATCVYNFAQFVRRSPYAGMKFEGVFTSAETLLQPIRDIIEETFQCRVFDRYGTLELGGVACECRAHSGMHISVENNFVEILHQGCPTAPGEVGDLIVTNLNNLGMPFIRYSIGDLGTWFTEETCTCGRSAPRLSIIEGRITEMFQTRDGHYIRAGFSGGFSCLTHPAIKQFQVIQKSLDKMIMRLVPDGVVPQSVLDEIEQTIHATFGDNVVVDFEFLDKIQPMPSGKHQYAISELNKT
jgi:phenylacetate-CoA ligase